MPNILVTTIGTTWQIVPELIGFTNPACVDLYKAHKLLNEIENEARRECDEEIFGLEPGLDKLEYLGIINEEITKVGKNHLGVLFKLNCYGNVIPGDELNGFYWLDINSFFDKDSLELWSVLSLELLK